MLNDETKTRVLQFRLCGRCGGIIIDADRIIFLFWVEAREDSFTSPLTVFVFCKELLLII